MTNKIAARIASTGRIALNVARLIDEIFAQSGCPSNSISRPSDSTAVLIKDFLQM